MLMVMYMMVTLKIVINMEKVHLQLIVDRIKVMYMLVNINMIRSMDMVNGLMQMVLSIMMECGNMVNECASAMKYFCTLTSTTSRSTQRWIKHKPLNKHGKTTKRKNKKTKNKIKIPEREK